MHLILRGKLLLQNSGETHLKQGSKVPLEKHCHLVGRTESQDLRNLGWHNKAEQRVTAHQWFQGDAKAHCSRYHPSRFQY